MKVVRRHLDGTIAEELDYYSSGRYFFLGGDGPHMEKDGIHDEFVYLSYKYDSKTLSVEYVGKDVDIYDKCRELNSKSRTFAEVTSVADEILAIWRQSRL